MPPAITETRGVCYREATSPEHPKIKWRGFKPGNTVLSAGTAWSDGGRETTCDIVLERDMARLLRDGTRIYLDVYRPVTDTPLPAIISWSPYGKQGSHQEYNNFPGRAGVPKSATSGLGKSEWEGCDPAFFCANGYVVVCPDPRGAFESDGDVQFFSAQEGLDVSQWIIAATQPPHLKCIAPWEGFGDVYRDLLFPGGIPRPFVAEKIIEMNASRHRAEDLAAMMKKHPYMSDYWRGKIFGAADIRVPAYVVASWTNSVHTVGTFKQYQQLDHDKTWLRVHNTMEWPDLYEYEGDLLKFFDYFLKSKQNGWDQTPRVRLSVLDPGNVDTVNRPELEYPLTRSAETKYFLDAATMSMAASNPVHESYVDYDAQTGKAMFAYSMEKDVEIVGPMKLRLWLETDVGYEADVFVCVRKADGQGSVVSAQIPPGMPWPGATGRLRASHRQLDVGRSTELVPVLSHDVPQAVMPGEPMALDIAMGPVGMRFHAGEQLQIVITGHTSDAMHPVDQIHQNIGKHIIRSGGEFQSYLLVPVVEI